MIVAGHPAPPSVTSGRDTPNTVADTPQAVGASGLTATEAARRLSQFGPNQVVTGGRFHVLRTGLGLLANPLVLILLAASVVSGIVGEALDAAIIVTIVLAERRPGLLPDLPFRTGSQQAAEPGDADRQRLARCAAPRDPRARRRARRRSQPAGGRPGAGRCAAGLDRHAQRRSGRADRRIAAGRETRRRRP